ncbi:MAG: DUF1211 domain-containing protein [Bacteroidetes bacterium]|nr:DUF1211 domain-containing protein [Bacteroidota bacterium]
MKTNRLEAFSDGVIAIIITIMVLQLKAPEEITIEALIPKIPIFISYLVSFIYIGIFWNNHHHLFQITENVNGKILWANLHLLFWLSLIPFATAWIGQNHVLSTPVAFYGFVLFMCGIAFSFLKGAILKHHPKDFDLHKALGGRLKEKLSIAIYILGIIFCFVNPWFGIACYVFVAIMWVIPDKRIEKIIQ